MLACPKCGVDNPLGRVFCGKCGSKLDFANMSNQEITERGKATWFSKYWKTIIYFILAIVAVFVGLILWPKTGPVGKVGKKDGDRRTAANLQAIGMVRKGESRTIQMTEEEINAFFDLTKSKALLVDSVSFGLMQQYFVVRVVKPLGPKIRMQGFEAGLKLSYELSCVPVQGRILIQRASIGHFPLAGGMKSIASGALYASLIADKDLTPLTSATDIRVDSGRIQITVKP